MIYLFLHFLCHSCVSGSACIYIHPSIYFTSLEVFWRYVKMVNTVDEYN